MLRAGQLVPAVVLSSLMLVIGGIPGAAQSSAPTGKLKIKVSPNQAYVFADGAAIRDGSQTIALTGGQHTITVENYGYLPQTRNVQITPGKDTALEVTLQKSGDKVSGPFGDIEFKGHPRAAVLLNGTTPPYFVGHVDEFDNNFIWHQWLLVKPGTYQATVTEDGKTIWSGPVPVAAGKRVVVYLNDGGKMVTKNFAAGLHMPPQPRFNVGIAGAQIPIAPVTAQFAASPKQMDGGQTASLNWKTTDAVDTSISHMGEVAANGDKNVNPCQTTTYQLTAKGPGGEATQSATVDVNSEPTATLSLSQPEVTYRKVGDKVVQQGSATLRWTSSNATAVSIQPLGGVALNGSQNIEAMPGNAGEGPVQRDVTYTLRATNVCGGSVTRTATLHITGEIQALPAIRLASVFYPSNYPDKRHMMLGLMPNEKTILAQAAAEFMHREQMAGAEPLELMVVGHADTRGAKGYNMTLSERRAELVKQYLVSQGIAADKIKLQADGKSQELDQKAVEGLQAKDPQAPPKWMDANRRDKKATWLAYNRRVDIILEPAGTESTEAYPNDATDARLLWQRAQPNAKRLESEGGNAKSKTAKGL